jgi:hypothetical protein
LGVGAVGLGATPATAAPYDISPQRVAGAYTSDGLHVFVRGTTGYIYQKLISPNGQQSAWTQMGDTVASSPAATVDNEGRIYVAARAANGNVVYRWRQPTGAWTTWVNVGGSTYGAPALQAIQGQTMDSPDNQVTIAALDSGGRLQARQFLWNSTTPSRAAWATWQPRGTQQLAAAPNLGAGPGCQAPDDNAMPYVPLFEGRSVARTGIGHLPCESADNWPTLVNSTIASSIDSDAEGRAWYRGTDGALWANSTRIGVPAAGLRVACSPTVSGYEVPVFGDIVRDPSSTAVLIRDNTGASWRYTPPAGGNDGAGGTWTSLGGKAT